MKNSSARQGTLHFTPEEYQKIDLLKETAEAEICWDGEVPRDCHRATLCGIDVVFFKGIDRSEECGQYQLHVSRRSDPPGLDEVQAMAVAFFGNQTYQIMPHERNHAIVRVMGLFFSFPSS